VNRDIAAFFEARLDEEEAAASAATPGPWHPEEPYLADVVTSDLLGRVADCSVGTGYRPQSLPDAAHIALHGPDRTLREVEAKRRMLVVIEDAEAASTAVDNIEISPYVASALRKWLAYPYQDHLECPQELKP
jgi:hypothetical protein